LHVGPGSDPPACSASDLWPFGTQVNWAVAIRQQLSCGSYRLAGRQQVDGVETLRLVTGPLLAGGPPRERDTIWVNLSTYLPVRTRMTWASKPRQGSLTADIRWLRPTRRNLATFRNVIPPGFRKVTPADIVATFAEFSLT
jgi:hypothetical protein